MAANQSTARKFNMREIIDALMQEDRMSRAGLAKVLGLSKPATAENVEKLIGLGLVMETGEGDAASKGGRKPRLLSFNKLYRTVVCVDLSLPHAVAAIGNLQGEVLAKAKLGVTADESIKEKTHAVITGIRQLMYASQCPVGVLGVIILCAPGVFREDNTPLHVAPEFRGWTDIGLDHALAREFMAPVLVKNNMSAAALGEYSAGICDKSCRSMVFVNCGMRLGAGLVLDGKLYEGGHFAAGEISGIVDQNSYQNGTTIERRMSIGALLADVERDIREGRAPETVSRFVGEQGRLKFSHLITANLRGNDYIAGKMRGVGRELGFVVAGMAALLNMEYVVIGGEYVEFFDIIRPELEAILNIHTPVPPQVVAGCLGDGASLQGGLVFGRNRLFDKLEL